MGASPLRRIAEAPPLAVDGLLAAAVAVVQVVGAAADVDTSSHRLTPVAVLLLVAAAAPLTWRRSNPVAVLGVIGGLSVVYGIRPYPDPYIQIPLLIALATTAARCSRRTTLVVAAISAVVALVALVGSQDSGLHDYYAAYLTTAFALVLGDWYRIRAEQLAVLEQQAADQQQRAEAEAASAASAERSRIAREMHDVIAHHVSMVVVQAEAGAAVTDGDAATRFDAIAGTGRAALRELRRVLGVLRSDAVEPIEPQPGLAQLDDLLEEVRRSGMAVALRVEGPPRPVPPGIDLTAYRIVQEALTNVARHARGADATVTVRYRPGAIEVEVADTGAAVGTAAETATSDPAAAPAGIGHGLVGIRERVAMCGGTMRSGPGAPRGFVVAVELPCGARLADPAAVRT